MVLLVCLILSESRSKPMSGSCGIKMHILRQFINELLEDGMKFMNEDFIKMSAVVQNIGGKNMSFHVKKMKNLYLIQNFVLSLKLKKLIS